MGLLYGVSAQNADRLVEDMVNELGGKKAFYDLNNVSYDMEYSDPNSGMSLKSRETYVFENELSHAVYSEHSALGAKGKVSEGFNGADAWIKFDGKIAEDKQAKGMARFFRKTNFYWFSMLFKLQDEGVNLQHIGSKKTNGSTYDVVRVTFDENIGDTQDTYVLYINKETKLVDQFLFTVVAFGITEPELMTLRYETINGIKVPSERAYIASNWDAEVVGKTWAKTTWRNIEFNKEIGTALFDQ